MYLLTKTTETELNRVQATITKELSNEKIIQEIYEYIFNVKGKKTRALLCLLASKSSDIKPKNRIALASIIELLHTATLVHDDVVDDSERRRGTESVNQVWTNSYSVLMGDFIYSKAFILMVKIGISSILDELAKATNDIARGEIIQLELFGNKQPISLDDLLKVSYLKTGRLFEASAKTGAMLACKPKEEIKIFGQLGKALGTAFQIQDDILDYEAFKLDIGKPALKDFREGKITFPLYFALQNANKKNRRFLLDRLGQSKLLKKDQNTVYQLIQDDKTQKEINALLDKYIKETLKHLNKLKHHPCYNEMLDLINFSHLRKI
ncbi:polyprenyl synthetase family protein [Gammaproteobacteria bacterium]|nr:polyprenyl synthetase family protein [Gammaproteobacteria bacterium]MDC1131745.1 polyprenyl synthetase family protein [Gammaproteobacteria bacterium]